MGDGQAATSHGEARIHIRIPKDLKRKVRIAAAEQDQNLSEYLRELIRGDIDE